MSQIIDKKHWFDGWFYSKFVDTFAKEMREIMSEFIVDDSSVIDIGCGTGDLVFKLAKKCKYVVGIDLSSKMIQFANQQKEKAHFPNVEFIHADGVSISEHINKSFDYATASFVLHEMSKDDRMKAIKEMKGIAKEIIIGDYAISQPKSFLGILGALSEGLQGLTILKNYWSFVSGGGIDGLLVQCGLKIEQVKMDESATCKFVKVVP